MYHTILRSQNAVNKVGKSLLKDFHMLQIFAELLVGRY
jgi:hypothetical protein